MIPLSLSGNRALADRYFLVEKTGMQIAHFGEEDTIDNNAVEWHIHVVFSSTNTG